MTASAVLAAIACLRSEPCEAGGLLAVELAKFGHFDEHGDRGEHADAGNGNEDLEARGEIGVSVQAGFQSGIDGRDLAVDLRQALSGMALEQRCPAGMLTVPGGGPVLDQGEPGDVRFLYLVDGLTDDGPHRRCQQRTHAGEHGGIDGIGLGMGAGGLGEAPGL